MQDFILCCIHNQQNDECRQCFLDLMFTCTISDCCIHNQPFLVITQLQCSISCISSGECMWSSAYNVMNSSLGPPLQPAPPRPTSLQTLNYSEESKGERGLPCLTPMLGCTYALFLPSIKTYRSFSCISPITRTRVSGMALRCRCFLS